MRPNRFPGRVRSLAAAVVFACAGTAAANPQGPSVAAGSATFQTAGKTLTVTNAPGTIINWNAFSIGSGETTRFLQQSAASAVLNRAVGNDPSSLLGTLTSNGRVFLINPHGIVVGAGARIDTAGFIASTLNMTDADFLNNRLRFEGGGFGVVRNEGTIRASGDIMLVGPRVENAGLIKSDNGSVLLAAGQRLTITSPDAQGVKFELQAPTDTALNVGAIEARNAVSMFAGTLKHSGDIRAGVASLDDGGRVILAALGDTILDQNATIVASGTSGGTVHVLGDRVALADKTFVDASGENGGGTILVGGDFQGKNPLVKNASQTYIGPDVRLRADAISAGHGGKVVIWSDYATQYHGGISARGGALSGNGGAVEVSGKAFLDFRGTADTRAPNGEAGTLLLDPTNINIVELLSGLPVTPEILGPVTFFANTGLGAPPAISEVSTSAIANALNSTNVVISTASSNATSEGTITLLAPLTWTPSAPMTSSLAFFANTDLNINNPITYNGGQGGGLNIVATTGGATNIRADISLGGGSFDAMSSGGTGIVNFVSTAPSATIAVNTALAGSFTATTINSNSNVEMGSRLVSQTLNINGGRFSQAEVDISATNISVAGGATFATNAGFSLGQGVTLSGTGIVDNGIGAFNNSGILDLTANAGSPLTIIGTYIQAPDGLMRVSVGNPAAGPALIVTGGASLGGTLSVSTAPGFAAPAGSTFNLISGVYGGDFTTKILPAQPTFSTVTLPTNYLLLQQTNLPSGLPVTLPPGNTTTVNSLLSLSETALILFTPQGVQIATTGTTGIGVGQCQ